MDRRGFLKGAAATTGAVAIPTIANAAPAAASSAAPTGGPWDHPKTVLPGVEVLARSGYQQLAGQRVGLISNPTGLMPDMRHEFDAMHAADGFDLVAGFGPEHGFRGTEPPGGHDDYFVDPRTGVPVYSSYTPQNFARVFTEQRIDTVVFDIQDVGARFYTYIWTMYRAMHGSVLAGNRFMVLDRPNPINGLRATGPVLDPAFSSGVGLKAISQRHGMTVGELARLFNAEFLPADAGGPADLTVIEIDGWTRDMYYEQTGLPWVLPSPNMPTIDTAFIYPGTCLFEATNLSEGRGTTRPFELIGAPYIDYRWAGALSEQTLPGIGIREAYFKPLFSKHNRVNCGGVQVHVHDRRDADPIHTALAMIIEAKRLYPDQFSWRETSAPYWIDKLTGTEWVRTAIDSGANADEVVAGWQHDLTQFRQTRETHLLYHQTRGGDRP